MELKFKDKIVLLTGATGGIGQQICKDFLKEGALVVCAFRNEEKFQNLVQNIKESDLPRSNVFGVKTDLLKNASIQELVSQIVKTHRRIDILINCAGTVIEAPFAMLDEEQIDNQLNINLKAVMMLTKAVLKPMVLQKEGSIVNVSSITAQKGGRGIVAYASAKAGLDAFTRSLAIEVGRKNIRVNSVRPGAISTEMSKALKDRAENYIAEATILGRFGTTKEISNGVLFLASNEVASFITGTNLNIDGGFML